ncbi:MAG TPA: molybdopterin-dependent oxidoreductase [Dehalococcoidia bacterium]|nr:molybdopterin-dependent oxidoreductase [Dehalococcoidia bacterium]
MAEERLLSQLPRFPMPREAVAEGQAERAPARLRVDGLVRTPLALALAQVLALPVAEFTADFACEEGWRVPGLRWTGTRLADVLRQAGPLAAARYVAVGAGAFVSVLPLAQIGGEGPLLAYELDGAPLPREHGGPLRLIASWTACYQSVKWVDHLELVADERLETAKPIALGRIGAPAKPAPQP